MKMQMKIVCALFVTLYISGKLFFLTSFYIHIYNANTNERRKNNTTHNKKYTSYVLTCMF